MQENRKIGSDRKKTVLALENAKTKDEHKQLLKELVSLKKTLIDKKRVSNSTNVDIQNLSAKLKKIGSSYKKDEIKTNKDYNNKHEKLIIIEEATIEKLIKNRQRESEVLTNDIRKIEKQIIKCESRLQVIGKIAYTIQEEETEKDDSNTTGFDENYFMPFEGKQIRKIWHNEEWYFSITDVIDLLTDSKNPPKYWSVLKSRENQLKSVVVRLSLDSYDGNSRMADCTNVEGLFRIIMSVPSPKAEPLKLWMASIGGKPNFDEAENKQFYTLVVGNSILDETTQKADTEAFMDWYKKHTTAHLYLAAYAAFPLQLTADLLYKIWQNFKHTEGSAQSEIPRIAVSDLLLSGLLHETSTEVFEYAPDLRKHLLQAAQQYFKERGRADILTDLATFMLDYLSTHYVAGVAYTEPIREAEEWNALAYLDPTEAHRRLAAALNPSAQKNYQTRQLRAALLVENLDTHAPIRALDAPTQSDFERILTFSKGMRYHIQGKASEAYQTLKALPEFGEAVENAENTEGVARLELPKGIVQKTKEPTLQEKIAEKIQETQSKRLVTLDLSNLGLVEIPSEISEFTWLKELNLSRNEQLSDLTALQNLVNLCHIDIRNTSVHDLSPIKNLVNLQFLNLSKTAVIDLSPLSNLVNLQQLHCYLTQISSLQPIEHLINLELLDIAVTQVMNLRPIRALIQKENMPVKWEFATYARKNGIYVKDCPLINPPIEVVKQGNEAILNYFEQIENMGGVTSFQECKLLIVGEGGAGKTTLAMRLLDNDGSMPLYERTTTDINIHPHKFILADGSEFTLHIWDFAGQEMYHLMHQSFFSKRSLYVFVEKTEINGNTNLEYWLDTIKTFGGDSPVIIVQNEINYRTKQLDEATIRNRYSNVRAILQTNLQNRNGVDKIRETIRETLLEMPSTSELVPNSWMRIRNALENLKAYNNYIILEEYLEICNSYGIQKKDDALHLSTYLHDLGILLHFQDNSLLSGFIILRHQWVINAIYELMYDDVLRQQHGVFTQLDIDRFWSTSDKQGQKKELLELLRIFETAYKLPDTEIEKWLVPQLLPLEKPELNWEYKQNCIVRYKYDFMPRGILSRLIVRLHTYIGEIEKVWRTGFVISYNGTSALITEDYGTTEIKICVEGGNTKELLAIIYNELDRINQQFSNIKIQKLVACTCSDCTGGLGVKKGNKEIHFFDYANLLKRVEMGKKEIECYRSFENVSIEMLLNKFG